MQELLKPIFDIVDHVMNERLYDQMFIQHEGPYYDIMGAVKRDFEIRDGSIVSRTYRFERPKSRTDSYALRSDLYSQGADLSNLDTREEKFRHVVPLWRVRKPVLDELGITFQIEHPIGFLMPMIALSKQFSCVEVMSGRSSEDDRSFKIAFFTEEDAIAAQAMLIADRD